jgi:hyperosmotically inducible protein
MHKTPFERFAAIALVSALSLSIVACSKPVETAASTTVGTEIDDTVLTTRVKAALLNDASIKSLDIAVVTRQGEVQLSGFVDNQAQIDKALQIAQATQDVKRVGNELSIKK